MKNRFPGCNLEQNPEAMPLFNLLVPPETDKNPYTGEPMKRQMIPFPEGG